MRHRVLVVDDEQDVARLISFNLGRAGFDTEVATTAGDALLMAARQPPVVVVLDLMLPDSSGVEVCRRLREDAVLGDVGVLMLTALGDQASRITGLEAGADDYVVKPFDVREIVLRVSALARRVGERRHAREQPPSQRLVCGSVSVDPVTHDVRLGDRSVELRPLEFKLLVTLLGEPGKVFSRESSCSGCGTSPTRPTRARSTSTCGGCGRTWASTQRWSRPSPASATVLARVDARHSGLGRVTAMRVTSETWGMSPGGRRIRPPSPW